MNKKIIIAIIFVVLLVAVVVFVKRNTVLTTPLPPHIAGETPPPFIPLSPEGKFKEIDIAGWYKVYRNEKYGFEIKYPNDWYVKPSDSDTSAFISFAPKRVYNDFLVGISIGEISMSERLERLRTAHENYEILSDKKIMVNGISMTQVARLITINGSTAYSSIFTDNNKAYSYVLRGGKDEKDVYNAMVSTFRFLE